MLQPHQRRPLLIAATILLAAVLGFVLMPKPQKSTPGDIMSYDQTSAVVDENDAEDATAANEDAAGEEQATEDAVEAEEPVKSPEQQAAIQIQEQGKKGCEFDKLIGLPFSESLIATADRPYRLIHEGDALAQEQADPKRINLYLDKDNNIEKVTCE